MVGSLYSFRDDVPDARGIPLTLPWMVGGKASVTCVLTSIYPKEGQPWLFFFSNCLINEWEKRGGGVSMTDEFALLSLQSRVSQHR